MLEAFDVHKGMHILEIGAGTGYNAALMAHMVGDSGNISSIDIESELIHKAKENLQAARNIHFITGDGALGYALHAPYDRIVATVGFWDAPFEYLKQLKPTGRFVAPLWLLGEPQDYVLVNLENRGNYFEGHGITGLRMVIMRGINAADKTPLQTKKGKDWQGSSLEQLKLSIYPLDSAPTLKAQQKHIFKSNSVTVLERLDI